MHKAQPITEALLDEFAAHLMARSIPGRFILGIAGIGGSGKSTLAHQLIDRITPLTSAGFARLVPMDGHHLTNLELVETGLLSRKGAPETFDAHAYIDLLHRARMKNDAPLPFPIYSRVMHEPVIHDDDEHSILPATRLIVTEGNYLLLDESPWSRLVDVLDECWLLDTPIEQAKRWILDRHVRGGRVMSDALKHYARTDLSNARLVHEKMRRPDRVLRWAEGWIG